MNVTVTDSAADTLISVVNISDESKFEYWSNFVIGVAFLVIAALANGRMSNSKEQGGSETTVVTAFYTLILITASFRSVWFLIPNSFLKPNYTPSSVMAFSDEYPHWFGAFMSQIILSSGSLSLFSIFILILVYWADILKKYFYPGAQRSKPMATFVVIVCVLIGIEITNSVCFLMKLYSTEAMILLNAIVLAFVSVVCVFQISVFSHKFRTVLKTLGHINQVSTESQVKRIVWITVTGNAFFTTRAVLEIYFAGTLYYFWRKHGNVDKVFTHGYWDTFILLTYLSEFAILCLMLYILKSKFTKVSGNPPRRDQYSKIPDGQEPDDEKDEGETAEKTEIAPPIDSAVVV